jgi:hypothetical protein
MVNNHKRTFFGEDAAITIQSTSRGEESLFLSAFGKLSEKEWEKPSQGQGKKIKLSLEELVSVLRVLKQETKSWSTYHTFKSQNTPIAFNWTDKESLSIKIEVYFVDLDYAQIQVLRLLLEHILNEKIIYATVPGKTNTKIQTSSSASESPSKTKKTQSSNIEDRTRLDGAMTGKTAKALLIRFEGGKEEWIPKSAIHNEYKNEEDIIQPFLIDNWVLEKNGIIERE